METKGLLIQQYAAAAEMLSTAVRRCPDGLWRSPTPRFPFWRVAYHSLFFTHLYASGSIDVFAKWEHHFEGAEDIGKPLAADGVPYSIDQVQAYSGHVMRQIRSELPDQDMDGPSGIPWWGEFTNLEMHVYNIRHLQHHVGQLVDRLRNDAGVEIDWVGKA